MVKGVARRVVVVKPHDSRMFEEAIFMMREAGTVNRDALREACAVAEDYLRVHPHKKTRKLYTCAQMGWSAVAGALGMGAVWLGVVMW